MTGQSSRLKAVAQQQEPGALVQKNGLCFLERNAMLDQVSSGLAPISGKFDIAHSIVLAIPAREWS